MSNKYLLITKENLWILSQSRSFEPNHEEKGGRKVLIAHVYHETYVFIVYVCTFRHFLQTVSYDVRAIIELFGHAIL